MIESTDNLTYCAKRLIQVQQDKKDLLEIIETMKNCQNCSKFTNCTDKNYKRVCGNWKLNRQFI